MRKFWLIALVIFLLPALAIAETGQSVTVSRQKHKDYRVYVIDWTSGTGGATNTVSQDLSTATGGETVMGWLESIETIPGASGDKSTYLPTSYSMTLLDPYGLDITGGVVTSRSASVAQKFVFTSSSVSGGAYRQFVAGALTLTISNASISKKGRVILTFSPAL